MPSKPGSAIEADSRSAGNLRGQVATEFMLYIAVFIFMAMMAFVVINDLQTSEVPFQQNTVAKETGNGFATVLSLSVKGGEGFSYNYTFPKTLFGRPYGIYLSNLQKPNATILLEFEGEYGNFSYQYNVPQYKYVYSGGCLSGGIVDSARCSNMLMLNNYGENLTIVQLP